MVRLRCLTFNIWKNEGQFARRMAAIADLVAWHAPDVVALQECFVAPALGVDAALGVAGDAYHVTRFAARAKERWHLGAPCASRSDMAILTRDMPLVTGRHALPEDARDGERGLLWVDLPVGGLRIRLGCTHLTHLHDQAAEGIRRQQAACIAAVLLHDVEAAILMGDFNATSGDAALVPIFHERTLCPVARDMAQVRAGAVPANGAIDHVLAFSRHGTARLIDRRMVCTPDAAGFPSDHPAILAEIEIG